MLKFNEAVGRVLIGDPKIADVVPLGDHTIYVLGKAAGTSSLTVLPPGENARPIAAMDLHVGFDVDSLERGLRDTMPGEDIHVSVQGDGLMLAGLVSSSAVAARAVELAEHYAPKNVINLLSVRAAEQVMLQVQVAEVKRSVLRQLGITNVNAQWVNNGALGPLPTLTTDPNALLNLGLQAFIGKNVSLNALLTALESKGYATVLAEPTLTALSGQTAVFFAGGEYPVPVPQIQGVGQTTITIDFKPYGVSVGFTPTVTGDTINLAVSPEVSALDPANSVNLQGYKIPGITTRRAKTTVELRNGQSFAIAGLIQRDFTDTLRGLPGAASLPVFGALFRSTSFENDESEVVIIVTAHLAQPTERKNLRLPTDNSEAPTGAQLSFTSAIDNPRPAAPAGSAPSQGPLK